MKRIILIAYCLYSVLSTIYIVYAATWKNREIDRLRSNQLALTTDLYRYQTADSLQAVRARTTTVTIAELRESNSSLRRNIESLNIKLRDVASAAEIAQSAHYQVPLHDTTVIVVRDTVTERIAALAYTDRWASVFIHDRTADIRTRDSLTVVRHTRKRKFLFWTFRRYSGEVTVKNANPYVTIESLITIDKK